MSDREDEWDAAKRRALEGYTGPLDAVRPGDFAEALRLLLSIREMAINYGVAKSLSGEELADLDDAHALLARLSPSEDTP